MKKAVALVTVIFCMLVSTVVFASNTTSNKQTNTNVNDKNTSISQLVQLKEKEEKSLEDYKKAYGSDAYGFTAYLLNKIQIYSIPFCFVGIAISAIYQYVLGIRKMDVRDKGFLVMISIVTLFVIAQVLPLIFAIVVRGWGD